MASLLEKLLRSGDKRILKQLRAYTDAVNSLEDSFVAMTDEELRAETDSFRQRVEKGENLDLLLPEAFAVVREASKRTLGKRHYDVQLMGGAALHLGNIAEMKTGEGKTLVATAPAYLNALSGKGVHVITVNDYLAEYQANLMGRVFRFLGMETGVILANQSPEVRRKQYEADVTYGTNNEFGLNLDFFLGFNCLVDTVVIAAPSQNTPSVLIDNHDFAVHNNIVLVGFKELFSLDGIVEEADEGGILRFIKILDTEVVFNFINTAFKHTNGTFLFIDLIVLITNKALSDASKFAVPAVSLAHSWA